MKKKEGLGVFPVFAVSQVPFTQKSQYNKVAYFGVMFSELLQPAAVVAAAFRKLAIRGSQTAGA